MSKVKIRDSVRRIEDLRFLTGTGNYIDDVVIGGEVVGVVVRSPYAHAKINGFDATDAEALDGVLAVITGAEWAAQNFGPIPTNSAVKENRDGTPISVPDRPCLASERVRYVGEAVAFVVAETLAIARQAVELVDVDYDPLPAVTH
ncbi:MAG: xanthine dehydrogenase family protein molybdopterin-binding subunit, partial [Rhodospirillaceae bacterium]|nr:xanthine dehydrogenase family protein molybdopterin-binding subunit [Rhodospirillaceae bacterium]